MSGELQAFEAPGLTLYAVLLNSAGKAYNGSAFVTVNPGDWATYDIALTESAAGIYTGDMPTVGAGVYSYAVYSQAGASPATSDTLVGNGSIAWDGSGETSPVSTTGDYCTLGELKAKLWPSGATPDTTDDVMLARIITAASREIDGYTGRRFYTTANDETRYYTTDDDEYLFPDDDILSVTTLKTDGDGDGTYEETWAATDYQLMPVNALLGGRPYTWIQTKPRGQHDFTHYPNGIEIVGKFGYASTTPAAIKEACLLHCIRLFRRKDAPFGVLGPTEMGQVQVIPGLDPDIKRILDSYRRIV